jgi:Chromo (CHRromatin Organisation MOdifier) domain
LDFKKLGLYKIVAKKLLINYKLRLPKGLRLYLVFHVSLLELALPGVVVSNEELQPDYELDIYNVEKILDSRVSKKKIEYLVKWLD